MTRLKLGIVDSSAGNGHMFSFSSLFNGYNPKELANCPFPSIVAYLPKYRTPVEILHKKAEVSAIWMDNVEFAEAVARFGNIVSVHSDIGSLLENVDGVILTNDEPVGRESILDTCLDSGKIVFVDKMIARTSELLMQKLSRQHFPGQLYCASALSFSSIFQGLAWDNTTECMIFSSPKNWSNYGIHVVDLFLSFADANNLEYEIGKLTHGNSSSEREIIVHNSGGGKILLRTEGLADTDFSIKVLKNGKQKVVKMADPFNAFGKMLDTWLSRVPEDSHLTEYDRYKKAITILGFDQE